MACAVRLGADCFKKKLESLWGDLSVLLLSGVVRHRYIDKEQAHKLNKRLECKLLIFLYGRDSAPQAI